MGGNSEGIGNASVATEFNFHADPEAALVVVETATCPVTLVPWETCYKVNNAAPTCNINMYSSNSSTDFFQEKIPCLDFTNSITKTV